MFRFLFTLTIGVVLGFILAKMRENVADQSRLREARDEAIRYRAQMAAARQSAAAEVTTAPPAAEPAIAPAEPVQNDDLTRINGIGPVFQSRLRAAGLHTYAHLAASDSDTVRTAAAAADWQKIEPERWIEEAAQFAAGG